MEIKSEKLISSPCKPWIRSLLTRKTVKNLKDQFEKFCKQLSSNVSPFSLKLRYLSTFRIYISCNVYDWHLWEDIEFLLITVWVIGAGDCINLSPDELYYRKTVKTIFNCISMLRIVIYFIVFPIVSPRIYSKLFSIFAHL